jgi:N-acetylglucosamine kinase-like BadF-type ATPase
VTGVRPGLLLGVDGGATKTIALVADPDGSMRGAARGGSSDIHSGDGELAVDNVAAAITEALRAAGADGAGVGTAVLSLCGADWPEDFAFFRDRLRDRLLLGAEPVILNDGFGALRSGTTDGIGMAITVGTGLAIGAVGADGRRWHAGYWPELAGSLALGRRSLTAITRAELGIGAPTRMRDQALGTFAQPSVEELLHAFTRRDREPISYDRLTPILLDAAAAFDGPARAIVEAEATCVAEYARYGARQVGLPDSGYTLVLAGGVMRHPSSVLFDAIASRIAAAGVVRPQLEPAAGVLLLAFDAAGLAPSHERLRATLPGDSFFDTR